VLWVISRKREVGRDGNVGATTSGFRYGGRTAAQFGGWKHQLSARVGGSSSLDTTAATAVRGSNAVARLAYRPLLSPACPPAVFDEDFAKHGAAEFVSIAIAIGNECDPGSGSRCALRLIGDIPAFIPACRQQSARNSGSAQPDRFYSIATKPSKSCVAAINGPQAEQIVKQRCCQWLR